MVGSCCEFCLGLIAGGSLAICAGVAILFYTQDRAAVLGDPLLVAIAGLMVVAVAFFAIVRIMVRRSGRSPVKKQLLYY